MTNEELAVKIKTGEHDLMLKLWIQVERFVASRARRFYGNFKDRCDSCGCTTEDLIQSGYLALVDAVNSFSPEKGFTLLTNMIFPLRNQWGAMLGFRTQKQYKEPLNSAGSIDSSPNKDEDPLVCFLADDGAEEEFNAFISFEWQRQLREAE